MKLREVLSYIARRSQLSFVAAEGLDEREVSLDANGVTLDELLNMVGRRVGADVHRAGNVFFLGEFQAEDRAVLVKRVRRLDGDEIESAVGVLLSQEGRQRVFDDGLCVIADKLQVLTRVSSLLEQVEQAEASVWAVQYYLVSLAEGATKDLGFDLTPSIEIAATFAEASAGGGSSAELAAGLDAILRATDENTDAELLIEHSAIVLDGVSQEFFEGESFPVVLFTAGEQGRTFQSGIEYVETGVRFESRLREYSETAARLRVKAELSELVAIVEDRAPQTTRTEFATEVLVEDGGVYLLRSHESRGRSGSYGRWLTLGVGEQRRRRTIQLWCRCARVGGVANERTGDVGGGPLAVGDVADEASETP